MRISNSIFVLIAFTAMGLSSCNMQPEQPPPPRTMTDLAKEAVDRLTREASEKAQALIEEMSKKIKGG
ncbi:hypothetical protein HUT03_04500 [Candidatus Liberibacter africanus]|uniref:Lipoprotein n=1 Tax=Candidatus Liberibacter africanus PTSAPSY TaxID=1277257 RepID=A0A0G3I3R1_LIBAF|nr:hypothetical protein [Candidatus Liberibacter africanus]AKK20499.1 hypothetical protein G293_04420 [Candidatus Liberibacter africanus PTSAPSY]QTP64213.1 hypothetical protein HUT03_04500 [Candidatus Liberibacter africanus]